MQLSPLDCSETHPGVISLRQQARDEGVRNPDNLPFMLCPTNAKQAVLLVHGFTASPWEMRLFAEHLSGQGIASLAVRLAGHGTTPEDLAQKSWEDWFNGVEDGYRILNKEFSAISLAGMSTGCLLSLALATGQTIDNLILFSPYLRVQHKLAPYAGWLRWLRPYHVLDKDTTDPHYYNRRPVSGIHQINRLIEHVKKSLGRIHYPVLAFNGEGDETVDINSGEELVKRLGSKEKVYKRYGPNVPHVLTREENPRREEMFTLAGQFLSVREEL
jgi:carboxylesterase